MHSEKIVKQKRKLFRQRIEAATEGVPWKKLFLKISQNSQERICARRPFIKKETLTEVFSLEFCELSKNNFFMEHLGTTASERRYCTDHFHCTKNEVFH